MAKKKAAKKSAAPQRPLTQREIRKVKKEREDETYIIIYNISKQMIPIQLKSPPGVDFYVGEQTVNLNKGKSGKFPMSRLRQTQLDNLQKSGRIRVENTKI
jgi:hypothetical protein